jgi:peptide/nickel transport system substrate-binding protein
MPRRIHAITLLLLAACAPSRRRTPDDTLVLAIETPMATDDPRYAFTNYDEKLGRLVAPGLTTVETPTAEARLLLAAKIDHLDDLTIDITLRDDVRFSDGNPVTAADVARTYTTVLDPKCESPDRTKFEERFASVEATSDKVVRFHLVQPLGMFFTDISFGIISFHGVPPGECHPPEVIGAGPYVLRELSAYSARLDANQHAHDVPRVPHLEIRFVPDASARLLMLVGGSLDLLQNSARPDLVDDIALRPRVQVHASPSLLLTYLMMNNDNPVLHDVRVREAIALAIDRPAIIGAKFGGRAVLASGLLPPSHWAYNGDLLHWNRDRARAEQLLDEAGYRRGSDGVRLHLVYKTSADAFRVTLARLIATQLGEVGIDVEVRAFEFATFFADIKKGNFEIATMQTSPITDPDWYYFYFNSDRIPDTRDPDAGNRWRYRSAEVDRLTLAGRRETDPAKRKAIYADVQRLVAHDLPVIPLWHEDNVVLSNVDVQGYAIIPTAGLSGLASATKAP